MDTSQSSILRRHPVYYFSDGTLIVIVGTQTFRVYGGLLARNSTVFSNMLEMPQPTEEREMIDGVPVVRLIDDLPSSFVLLLDFLLASPESRSKKWELENILDLLEIADKYMFDGIIAWAKTELENQIPKTLGELRDSPNWEQPWSWNRMACIKLIKLTPKFNLPSGFAAIAFFVINQYESKPPYPRAEEVDLLDSNQRDRYHTAQRIMTDDTLQCVTSLQQTGFKLLLCGNCKQLDDKRTTWEMSIVKDYAYDPLYFAIAMSNLNDHRAIAGLCDDCVDQRLMLIENHVSCLFVQISEGLAK